MLGQYNLLPLLKGWEYKLHEGQRLAVVRGAVPIEVLRLPETGWEMAVTLFTTDAYGTLIIEGQGAELRTEVLEVYPEEYRQAGLFATPALGCVTRYTRPDPASTLGLYQVVVAYGFHGTTLPYIPTIVVKLQLPDESTQSSALISAVARTVAITNKKLFIQSVRRVLGAKADLWIDPALLVDGPAEMEEKPK